MFRRSRKPKLFYGYIIVIAGFLIQASSWGMLTTFGIFFTGWLDEFNWTRADISLASSMSQIIMGSVGIIVGRSVDRIGPREIMTICGVLLGLGYILMSQLNNLWQLYLFYGLIVGIGFSGTEVIPMSTVARWFVKKRGIMTGIIKAGTGIGMLVMPLVVTWLIANYNWRNSYIFMGIAVLVVVVIAAQFLKRDPSQKGEVPYGAEDANPANPDPAEVIISFRTAARDKRLWMLCVIYGIILFLSQVVMVHIVPHTMDLGFTSAEGARIVAAFGGASIAGRIVAGNASDRVGSRMVMTICSIIQVGALIWLQGADQLWMLQVFAFAQGFAHGGFATMLSPLVAELFGLNSHGAIFSSVFLGGNIGGAIGPFLTGRIFDVTGSYRLAFLICAVAGIVVLVMTLLVTSTGRRKKNYLRLRQ